MTVENQLVNPASFANYASPRTTSHLTLINCFRTTGAKWRCVRIWLYFFIPKSGHIYSHTNSNNLAMTLISQDDHLTAGAWSVCTHLTRSIFFPLGFSSVLGVWCLYLLQIQHFWLSRTLSQEASRMFWFLDLYRCPQSLVSHFYNWSNDKPLRIVHT